MSSTKTQLKLGLLVLCTVAALLVLAVIYGFHRAEPVVRYHTYFDESVSGLDVGSSVKFRGLHIGSVASLAVAPDRGRIDVAVDITASSAEELGLATRALQLRARLDSNGLTGVKHVDLEPATPQAPPPELGFVPDPNYIPARPSFMHELEARAETVADQIPTLVDRVTASVDKVGRVFDDLEQQRIAERFGNAVDEADATMIDLHRFVRDFARARVPEQTVAVLAQLERASAKARGLMTKLEGDGDIEQTIRDFGAAARAFRELMQEIQREPDMLIKGRARSSRL
jgi:ABC-type transporter Mla subunit MlaD